MTVPTNPVLVHASAIAIDGRAVLLRGPSGAGKSDLALRLIDGGARLVADDQVELRRAGERVLVTAPAAIAGLIEVCEDVLGLAVPCVALSPFEASAAAKLRFALRAFSPDSVPAIIRR
ncbi:MAG: serine/threonine protein kinase [Alphaproteobacteria bacterium]|nr:MAG: serine/threonine protein kinase [Alphaproteobacteria bacterium]